MDTSKQSGHNQHNSCDYCRQEALIVEFKVFTAKGPGLQNELFISESLSAPQRDT
ncbi:MAG: hypothetical protein GF398_02065 [Chitinivibrionales bacterium]|nr:hypothetical protein [Chitinivibrionales bacterium]